MSGLPQALEKHLRVRSDSDLGLVFERREGQWLMVQDQNTPIK